jgi:hypothetical protein
MAPGLIVPNVARFTISGTYNAVPVANILDVKKDTGSWNAADALDQAKIIVSAWLDNVMPRVGQDYRGLEVSWVDMGSSGGSTGATSEGTGSSFPANGGITDAAMPGMVAYLIHKNITAARGSRQGRMFIAGVNEGATIAHDGNNLQDATVTAMNTALQDFQNAVNQDGGISSYGSSISVVHTKNTGTPADPTIVYVATSHVNSLTCDKKVHTQRRRMG